jgi:hypothetical protein
VKSVLALVFLLICCALVVAQAPMERTRLYAPPDPASPGGLKAKVAKPSGAIEQVLAVSTASVEAVYKGEIGTDKSSFQFTGLPVGKYDLVVIYADGLYEGLSLNREKSTLTPEDVKKIEASIQKSEPYFPKKFIHRLEGETGRGNFARAVCTYFRDKGSDLLLTTFEGGYKRDDFRRTFKLVILKDVGPGWQITRARDLYPVWMDPKSALPAHHHAPQLGNIRVADQIKDLGELDLSK